jgi:DNA-binding transcriptional ArsR family regulator
MDSMDAVFKALADPTRRSLLDELFEQDGQTLSALEKRLPMTRFGVMKHLRVLEEAGLVTTRRSGREKLHYLNPVPIRLVHDRWVSKYAEPLAAALSGIKKELEEEDDERQVRSSKRERNPDGVRDLHQDDAGAPLGGDHRS